MWTTMLVVLGVILLYLASSRLRSSRLMPMIGEEAPDFTLASQDGGQVSLQDFRGKWLVLYFYPKDLTPGCTIEARNFQRDQAEYTRRNAVVVGVSLDSAGSHQEFCAKEGLNFKLLADTSHKVSEQFGSLRNFGVAQIPARNTFLIDPRGRIARTFAGVDPAGHSAEVLAALDELGKSTLPVN